MQEVIVGDVISKQDLAKCKEDCNNTHQTMGEKIDEVKNDVNEVKVSIEKLPLQLLEMFENRFASKMTERIVYGMVAVMLLSILYAILRLLKL